ncbi:MAG: hypothetical protein KY476_03760 [Planctomycetes bacterium]|nr:hypothetical protein [Planctomycetota bacterium]
MPFWLAGGEICGCCLQEYHLEAEFRCVCCDGAVCPMCAIVTVRGSVVCSACEAAGDGDESG